MIRWSIGFLILFVSLTCVVGAEESFTIVIKDHQFHPSELTIPAGQKVKLVIDNQDPTDEEFESFSLSREKVIRGNQQGHVFIGPLKPGIYKYFGEFHPKTAQGTIFVQ